MDLEQYKKNIKSQSTGINTATSSKLEQYKNSVKSAASTAAPEVSSKLQAYKDSVKGGLDSYTQAVGKTMDNITTPQTDVASRLSDPFAGIKAIFTPKETVTDAEAKQRLTEGLQYQESQRVASPIQAGITQGYNIPDVEKTYQTTYDKYKQAGLVDKSIYKGDEIKETTPYKIGETIGTVGKFGTAYALGGGAVEKVVSPATGALAKTIGGKTGQVIGTMATEFAKDVAIGQPLNYIEGKQKGLQGTELAKYMGEQAIIDIVANAAFMGIGKGFTALRKMKKTQIDEVVEATAKETTLPKSEIENVIKQEIPDYKMSHRIDYNPEETSKLHNLTYTSEGEELIPQDFYTNPEWYMDVNDINTKESFDAMLNVRNNPDAVVTIYRGVPENAKSINDGDWISLSKGYAELEAPKNGKVISQEVKADEIIWDGNDINEFAYFSKDAQSKPKVEIKEQVPTPKIEEPKVEQPVPIEPKAPEIPSIIGEYKTHGDNTFISFKIKPTEKALDNLEKAGWEKVSEKIYKKTASKQSEASARMMIKRLEREVSPKIEPKVPEVPTIKTDDGITIPKTPLKQFDQIEPRLSKTQDALRQAEELKQSEIGKAEIIPKQLDELKANRYELIEQLDEVKKYELPIDTPKAIAEENKLAKQKAIDSLNKQISSIDAKIKETSKLDLQKQKGQVAKETERIRGTKKLETYKAEIKAKRVTDQYEKAEKEFRNKVFKDLKKLDKTKLRNEYNDMANEILDLVDTKAKGMSPKKEISLKKTQAYFDSLKADNKDFVMNPKIAADLERLNKLKINELTTEELKDIQDVVAHIQHLNKTKNALINNSRVRDLKAVQNEVVQNNSKPGKFLAKDDKWKEAFNMYFKMGATDPEHVIRMLGNYDENSLIYKTYQQLQDGVRAKNAFEQKARNFIKNAGISDKDLGTQVQAFKMGDENIYLTPQQKISVYLHSKNAQNMKHLIEGGGRTKDMAYTLKFTEEGIDDVIKSLTPQEKALADNLGYYFDKISKDALNKTSVDLDGFDIARVEKYYPITTDAYYRSKDFSKFENAPSIEGMGILKERQTSGNPIVIEDVFDVLDRNINQVSTYSGLAVPIRNVKAVFGNSKVRRALKSSYGNQVENYMDDLFKNLEGGYNKSNIAEDVTGKLISNSQKAVLGANVKVWLNQLASLPTATAELSPKYLVAGLTEKLPSTEIMEKFSPEIWKRNQGFITRETGQLKLEGASDIFTKPISVFDGMAIKKIWSGVEKEILDTTALKQGSDAFYEAVARRTEDVIHKTQPNYEALYRSRAGSQKGALPKLMTLFGTQRNKNYNLMYDAIATAKATGDFSKIKKVTPALITSSMVIAGLNTAQQEIRGQESNIGQNFVSSVIGTPYLIGDIFSKMVDGWDVDNIAESSINDLFDAVRNIADNRGSKTFAGKTKDLTEAIARLGGVPVANIRKYFDDALRISSPQRYYEYQQIWKEPTRSDLYSSFSDALESKDNKYLTRVLTDLRNDGVTQQNLKSSMKRKGIPEQQYRSLLKYLSDK